MWSTSILPLVRVCAKLIKSRSDQVLYLFNGLYQRKPNSFMGQLGGIGRAIPSVATSVGFSKKISIAIVPATVDCDTWFLLKILKERKLFVLAFLKSICQTVNLESAS